MSTLKVNSIIPVAGVPTGGGGGIVQTVIGTHSTEVSQSISSENTVQTTISDTGLTASITPTSTSSKVLVMVHQHYGFDFTSDAKVEYNFVVRDSSNNILDGSIGTGSEGTQVYRSLKVWYDYYYTTFLHSPNTTSAFTYKVGMNLYRIDGGTPPMYAQRHGNESKIILMEVSA